MSVNVVTVVQARTGSTRLPAKVLRPVAPGLPVLALQIRRLRQAHLAGELVVATTTDTSDDPILDLARAEGVAVVRGHPTDLVSRHLLASRRFEADVVVKVPSDCPLVDPKVIDAVIGRYLAGSFDYASNLHPPSWPDGQDAEAMSREALEIVDAEATRPWEREHTTPYLWEHPERFRLANVAWVRDCSTTHRVTLDYPEDLDLIRSVVSDLGPYASIADITYHLDSRPRLRDLNAAYRGVNWYRHHLAELRTVGAGDTRPAPGEYLGVRR